MRHTFVAVAIIPAALAVAQDEAGFEPLPVRPAATDAVYTARAGIEYQGSGNEYTSFESGLRIDGRFELNENTALSIRFDYQNVNYDFASDTGFVEDAWEHVHTLSLGGNLSVDLGSDWTAFGGFYLRSAREGGLEFDDSVIGGGYAGAMLELGDMIIGLGWGVEDRLQDNARFYPVLVFDWEISGDLRLSTIEHYTATGPAGRIGRTGTELIYSGFDRDLDLAVGFGYRFRRFRLDSDGAGVDGIGQDKGLEFWLRAAWRPTSDLTLAAYAGLLFNGELKIEDGGGTRTEEEYDTAGFLGLQASYRF